MIAIVVALALIVTVGVVTLEPVAELVAGVVGAWPSPRPRPYACSPCRIEYSDPRALAWHQAGQHPVTYDAPDHELDALACAACGTPTSPALQRCPACGAPLGDQVGPELEG